MKSMGSKKLGILIGLLFLLVVFSGIQVAKAPDPNASGLRHQKTLDIMISLCYQKYT